MHLYLFFIGNKFVYVVLDTQTKHDSKDYAIF